MKPIYSDLCISIVIAVAFMSLVTVIGTIQQDEGSSHLNSANIPNSKQAAPSSIVITHSATAESSFETYYGSHIYEVTQYWDVRYTSSSSYIIDEDFEDETRVDMPEQTLWGPINSQRDVLIDTSSHLRIEYCTKWVFFFNLKPAKYTHIRFDCYNDGSCSTYSWCDGAW